MLLKLCAHPKAICKHVTLSSIKIWPTHTLTHTISMNQKYHPKIGWQFWIIAIFIIMHMWMRRSVSTNEAFSVDEGYHCLTKKEKQTVRINLINCKVGTLLSDLKKTLLFFVWWGNRNILPYNFLYKITKKLFLCNWIILSLQCSGLFQCKKY